MKPGDTLTDDLGRTWTVDAHLGRGTWARTWAVRDGAGGTAVLKAPLTTADFADDAAARADDALAVASATAAMLRASPAHQPALLGSVGAGLLLPRLTADLEARLQGGAALYDVLRTLLEVTRALSRQPDGRAHGNLRPSNVLLDASGQIVLTDAVPPGAEAAHQRLAAVTPGRADYQPRRVAGDERVVAGADTFALCQALHRACLLATTADDARPGRSLLVGDEGLSRVALAALKDAAAARLKAEGANRRFAARAVERLGALLARGLSAEIDPSPPYRFRRLVDLEPRLAEVVELIHPAVETVSKPLLPTHAREAVFDAGQDVELAINVGTTAGVTAQEDLAVGIQLHDLDAAGDGRVRVPNARFTVKQYPSGRWRFSFVLPDVAPGRYTLRVAFMVKGAEDQAVLSEGNFQVRPTPGYVPPPAPAEARGTAIPLPERSHGAADAPRAGEVVSFPSGRPSSPAPVPAADVDDDPPTRPAEAAPAEAAPQQPEPLRPTASRSEAPWSADPPTATPAPARFEVPPADNAAWPPPKAPEPWAPPAAPAPPKPVVSAPASPKPAVSAPASPKPAATVPEAPPRVVVELNPPAPTTTPPVDLGLEDYPDALSGVRSGGVELPTYDDTRPPPSGPSAWLQRLIEPFGDPLNATVFLSSGVFIVGVLLAAMLRQC